MSYLITPEFKRLIQTDNLNQIINNDSTILENAMLDAQAIARENLVEKYEIDNELQDTDVYDNTFTGYIATNRVYLDAPAYDATKTYNTGNLTLNGGNVYQANQNITVPEAFTPAHWNLLGVQYTIFYIPYPKPLFTLSNNYVKGDQVFWDGKIYTCVIPTQMIDHETILQARYYSNLPLQNVFPNDPINGVAYWGNGVVYTVAAGLLPNAPWEQGDNRNRNLVRNLIAISIWICHDRIAPRNIPELRSKRYEMAMKWMDDAKRGYITADLVKIQPRSGGRIRWGSVIKNITDY